MLRQILRRIKKGSKRDYRDINPEDIFLDSANLPGYEESRLEGRIEQPIGERTFLLLRLTLFLIAFVFGFKLWALEIHKGEELSRISENNRLEHTVIFANRGVIYDRNGVELANNAVKADDADFAARVYAPIDGLAHVLGYVKYPSKDSSGNYYDVEYHGRDGVEKIYDEFLAGKNGVKLKETDVLGAVTSESVIDKPVEGKPLTLSLDSGVTQSLFKAMRTTVVERGFTGGAGVMMDVRTGEIIALTSYPEYSSNILTEGSDRDAIRNFLTSSSKPFLNRVTGGLYTPGSIIKPILALAALNEGVISPEKEILSTGAITVPNPYDPSKPSIFKDWKAHGWTDMREAIAVSSDTYFYSIGGGYGDQKGMGIDNIDKYLRLFGLTEKTGIALSGETSGVIPTPEWKKENFDGDIWRLGDTYITSIGQYGTQVTPLEAVRFVAAIANEGTLLTPTLTVGEKSSNMRQFEFDKEDWRVVKEGMREGVSYGSSVGLNVPYVHIAAKTGTAELGAAKKYIHSWSVGFFPFENPRYAYAVIMEHGPATNPIGATSVVRQMIDWMNLNAPSYFE